jgi:GT2 family glycosyltransferase
MGPGSGNALVKRKVFDHIGGFDPSMLYGGSDQDFFRRACRVGYTFAYAPKAVAHHIIPSYRLDPRYLYLTSRRWGRDLAYFDLREKGIAAFLLTCTARLVHAAFVTVPRLICARVAKKKAELVSRRCSLRFAEGYTRQTLAMLFPTVFSQKAFFGSLNETKFRNIRTTGFPSN